MGASVCWVTEEGKRLPFRRTGGSAGHGLPAARPTTEPMCQAEALTGGKCESRERHGRFCSSVLATAVRAVHREPVRSCFLQLPCKTEEDTPEARVTGMERRQRKSF